MKVLICDDALFMRKMLEDILTKQGHEVIGTADNGYGAVKRYMELEPDVVTMDITMPNMNGIEALKKIRDFDPEAHVIMCSALGLQEKIVEALKDGAEDFITKPFDPDRVREVMDKVAAKLQKSSF